MGAARAEQNQIRSFVALTEINPDMGGDIAKCGGVLDNVEDVLDNVGSADWFLVKCSGEKTGCTRCAKLGLDCTYLLSMAGRVPRWHKNRSSTENRTLQNERCVLPSTAAPCQSQLIEGHPTRPPEASHRSSLTSHGAESPFNFPFSDFPNGSCVLAAGINDSFDLHNHYEEGLAPDEPQWSPFASDFSALFNASTSGSNSVFGEVNVETLANYSSSNSDFTPDSVTHERTSHGNSPTRSKLSNDITPPGAQGVLMMTQIINIVEGALANKCQPVEVILGTIHKAGVALNGLISLHHQGANQRCFMLFTVVLHQIADLMEVGIESLDALNCQRVAESSGSTASNSILDRLDSINDLISSYQFAAASAPHKDDDKVLRLGRQLKDELDASLMTVERLISLAHDGQHLYQYGHERGTQGVGGSGEKFERKMKEVNTSNTT
ncbi:hypothetical protein NLG97_g3831 [Lecanicillium saksenae]|uniref:Uncharacterized protein n=1 Tax=Lecanicillium saksenae TaxID=468837 RepID=A0ACC1QY69_9HYPO|nr:hypothetical protein NLG97_g3831 [Lecanicillium saksenae]